MLQQLRISLILFCCLTILTGGVYPAVVTVIAQVVFPHAANGIVIPRVESVGHQTPNRLDWKRTENSARSVEPNGSALIGQPFTQPHYFWGRLSATAPFPYNAAASGGSNFAPTNPELLKTVQGRIDALRDSDPEWKSIPVDLVTASASGLDPHISPAAAEVQVKRVAKARRMTENDLRTYVKLHTAGPQFGLLGEPVVNVLQLNLALDQIQSP